MYLALLFFGLAHAAPESEIGAKRRFGVGIAAGFPPSVSLKAHFDRKNALSFHVGATLATAGLHLRLQFEQRATELKHWEAADLGLTWQAGVVVELLFGEVAGTLPVRFGLTVGVGLELRVIPLPVAAFVELAPVLYPIELASPEPARFLPAGAVVVVGARWYF